MCNSREIDLYLKVIGQLLQATLEVFTALHQVLDVVYARKVGPQQFKKVAFFCWHWTACKDLEEITKIITTAIHCTERVMRHVSKNCLWRHTYVLVQYHGGRDDHENTDKSRAHTCERRST